MVVKRFALCGDQGMYTGDGELLWSESIEDAILFETEHQIEDEMERVAPELFRRDELYFVLPVYRIVEDLPNEGTNESTLEVAEEDMEGIIGVIGFENEVDSEFEESDPRDGNSKI